MKINRLAINPKQETICIIFTHPFPNPSVPQNIAWQYNVTNLTHEYKMRQTELIYTRQNYGIVRKPEVY